MSKFARIAVFVFSALISGLLTDEKPADASHPVSLQLPWPIGHRHVIEYELTPTGPVGGQSYECGNHVDTENFNGRAIDFKFSIGQQVAAVAGGTVVNGSVTDQDDRGNFVEIEHGNGHRSRYLHLRSSDPWESGIAFGTAVSQGQIIGYSGDTGFGTGPHLHFDLKRYPAWIVGDPLPSNVNPFGPITPEPMSGWIDFGRYGLCVAKRSPTLVGAPPDADGDGFSDGTEALLGTGIFQQCDVGTSITPSEGWPPDFVDDGSDIRVDTVTVVDLGSFVAPLRRFVVPGAPKVYDPRWDIDRSIWSNNKINIFDLIAPVTGVTGHPPMFEGQRAFGKTCTASPRWGDRVILED